MRREIALTYCGVYIVGNNETNFLLFTYQITSKIRAGKLPDWLHK